jgi:tRNA threonylcarbamoyladenosine biosynthesis protein TsaE
MDEFKVLSAIGMWDVAREAIARLTAAPQNGAALLALSGELGAGKTTFTQALAGVLGASGPVQSPTYVIMKKHALSGAPWRTLVHIDAYRLKDAADLAAISWDELVADPSNLIVLEWPERVLGALPDGALWLRFSHDTPETRGVKVG